MLISLQYPIRWARGDAVGGVTRLPSFSQMKARSTGHIHLLEKIADGKPGFSVQPTWRGSRFLVWLETQRSAP